MPYIYPIVRLPNGARVCLQPDKTKTGARDGPMAVEIRRDVLCSISWLLKLLQYSEQLGQPVTNHVTRPQGKDKKSFLERWMSSSDVANRAKHHFAAAGLSKKYTVHGSRRGSMQHAVHVLGQSVEQVGAAAQIRTPGIVQRYLDPFRHTR